MHKQCCECGLQKPINEFVFLHKRFSRSQRTLENTKDICLRCNKLLQKRASYYRNRDAELKRRSQYVADNIEKVRATARAYHHNNKEEEARKDKIYREEHKDEISIRRKAKYQILKPIILEDKKEYYILNREEILLNNKIYFANNKPKINAQRKKRRLTQPTFMLRQNISNSINRSLKAIGASKKGSCLTKLPFNINELKQHLESLFEPWMNWNNRGVYSPKTWDDNDPTTWKWQIDHIIPHSTFHYEDMDCEEFQKCWALSNLRPLSAKQNVIEGNRS